MRPLGLFWRAFTTLGCMGHTREGWRKHFGPDADVGAPFLRPMGKIASTYPCDPRCPMGHMRRVVEHGEDFFRAVCIDGKCAKVDLHREDVVAFEVDLDALGRAVLPALGMSPRTPVPTPSHRTWHIGTYTSTDGHDVPVIVSTAVMPYETKTCIGELLLGRMAPFILLIARPETLDLESASIIKREGCAAVVLQEAVGLDEAGRFLAARPVKAVIEAQLHEARSHLGASSAANTRTGAVGAPPSPAATSARLPAAVIKPARARAENVFRRDGETWILSFEGQVVRFTDKKGLSYLGYLLRESGQRFHAAELHAGVAGVEHVPTLGSAGDVLDQEAKAEYREMLQEVTEELADAKKRGHVSVIEELEERRLALVREIAKATGLGGRSRKASSDAEKLRCSITMSISREIKRIGTRHAALARHLTECVETGSYFSYRPDREQAWAA